MCSGEVLGIESAPGKHVAGVGWNPAYPVTALQALTAQALTWLCDSALVTLSSSFPVSVLSLLICKTVDGSALGHCVPLPTVLQSS